MSQPFDRPKAVIFDWDSTLVDNWGGIGLALNATFRAMGGEEWSQEEILKNTKHSLRDTFPRLFGDRWEEAMSVFYEMFEKHHLEEINPMPGAERMLHAFADLPMIAAIVSNKNGNYLRIEVEHMGWSDHFHSIIGATDAEKDKPAPDPIHLALNGTEIVASRDVWYVGDNPVDLECAHAAGCVPVLVDVHGHGDEVLAAHPPELRVNDCNELADMLIS